MASGFSNGTRFFKGCRTFLDSLKSTTQAYSSTPAVTPKSKLKPSSPAVSGQKPKPAPKREANPLGGLLKTYKVSPTLAGFLGQPEISRTEAVKQIWAYIKLNNLQNPTDKRQINCDAKLKAIFGGREKVGMLEIPKFLSAHFVKSG